MGSWEIGLAVMLLAVLITVLIVTQAVSQQKEKKRQDDRKDIARSRSQIDFIEEVIQNIRHIPHTSVILFCLFKHKQRCLEEIKEIDINNSLVENDLIDIAVNIGQINILDDKVIGTLQPPKSDKAAISMIKLIKACKNVVKKGYSRGHVDHDIFSKEMKRLEDIEIRVSIENLSSKIVDSMRSGHFGTAVQLLKKGIELLEGKEDKFSVSAKLKMKEKLEKLTSASKRKNVEARDKIIENEKDEIDELFSPKKKW